MSLFMSKEEVGKRVLRGIQRGDLFIMSHPEFRAGIVARNEALLRAMTSASLRAGITTATRPGSSAPLAAGRPSLPTCQKRPRASRR